MRGMSHTQKILYKVPLNLLGPNSKVASISNWGNHLKYLSHHVSTINIWLIILTQIDMHASYI